jgi:cholesterol transport system auxiliary component
MRYLSIGLPAVIMVIAITGCSISPPKQPAVHDFGCAIPTSAAGSKLTAKPIINIEAPKWLWDNRIRYRLLYLSPTNVRFYTLDRWIAPPPELFEQQLISSVKTLNYPLNIQLLNFEQQFDAPDRARVIIRFFVSAYPSGNKQKGGTQEFLMEGPTKTPDAAGAVSAFADLTRQAADRIQDWLKGLSM